MYPEGQPDLPARRPDGGFEVRQPPKGRAVIFEPHPAVRVALEYLLSREGYSVDARGEGPFAVAGPALMLVAVEDGLYVFVPGRRRNHRGAQPQDLVAARNVIRDHRHPGFRAEAVRSRGRAARRADGEGFRRAQEARRCEH